MNPSFQNILLSGASGLVGTALIKHFNSCGHTVFKLIRESKEQLQPVSQAILWDPESGKLDPLALEGMNTVIHLSGESIAQRWNGRAQTKIRDSRIKSTQTLVDAILKCKNPPQNFLCASATGFYGDCPCQILTEDSARGQGWAATLCEEWENAAQPLKLAGVRVLHMRFGVVISPKGGALAKMLPLFRWGLGAPLGSGQQMMSWITLEDLIRAVQHVIEHTELSGPVNFVSPLSVSNREFSKTLARLLKRPLMSNIPEFVVNLMFGQMGKELLLADQNVTPKKLIGSGFEFLQAELEDALKQTLLTGQLSR